MGIQAGGRLQNQALGRHLQQIDGGGIDPHHPSGGLRDAVQDRAQIGRRIDGSANLPDGVQLGFGAAQPTAQLGDALVDGGRDFGGVE